MDGRRVRRSTPPAGRWKRDAIAGGGGDGGPSLLLGPPAGAGGAGASRAASCNATSEAALRVGDGGAGAGAAAAGRADGGGSWGADEMDGPRKRASSGMAVCGMAAARMEPRGALSVGARRRECTTTVAGRVAAPPPSTGGANGPAAGLRVQPGVPPSVRLGLSCSDTAAVAGTATTSSVAATELGGIASEPLRVALGGRTSSAGSSATPSPPFTGHGIPKASTGVGASALGDLSVLAEAAAAAGMTRGFSRRRCSAKTAATTPATPRAPPMTQTTMMYVALRGGAGVATLSIESSVPPRSPDEGLAVELRVALAGAPSGDDELVNTRAANSDGDDD